jgi:hypothetical protein
MNKQTALMIATIILLLILGVLAYQNIKATGKVVFIPYDYDKGFDYTDYCEVDSEAMTCLPADKCEFQTDSEGRKVCLGIK